MANQYTITNQISDIRSEIEGLKKRMDSYEDKQKTQTELLNDVAEKINTLIGIGKWLLGITTTIAGGVAITYISTHLPK